MQCRNSQIVDILIFLSRKISAMFLFICMFLLFSSSCIQCLELHLTTSDEGYVTVIQGFAARLECTLSTCVRHAATVSLLDAIAKFKFNYFKLMKYY